MITFCTFSCGVAPLYSVKKEFEHKKSSSMCWDLDALGFLYVVCVVVASRFDGFGLKWVLVIFMLSDAIRLISEVPLLFLFSMP